MALATTVLRMVTGATMAAHGLQKLTCLLGGGGPEAAGKTFEKLGFSSGKQFAIVTGAAETTGGALMTLGLGTPLACSMVSGVMCGAVARVHYKNGFWNAQRGFEYNLLILAATFEVAAAGGGALTLDALRRKSHRGFAWAVAQLAVGAGAAWAALALDERQSSNELAPRWATSSDDKGPRQEVDLTGDPEARAGADPVH